MTSDQIAELQSQVGRALTEADEAAREVAFLKRLLRQAVLTAGGVLSVDPSLGEKAMKDQRALFVGQGEVRLLETADDLVAKI